MFAANKGLELAFVMDDDVPVALLGDSLRLQQILNNRISDTLKFTAKGRVKLSLSWKAEHRFARVTDSGVGMSPDELTTGFDAFRPGSFGRAVSAGQAIGSASVRRHGSWAGDRQTVGGANGGPGSGHKHSGCWNPS